MIGNRALSVFIAFVEVLDYRVPAERIQRNSIQPNCPLKRRKDCQILIELYQACRFFGNWYWILRQTIFKKNIGCLSFNNLVAWSKIVETFLRKLQQGKTSRMRTSWNKFSLYWQTKKSCKVRKCLEDFSGIFGTTESNNRSMLDNCFVVRVSIDLKMSIETLILESNL